MKTGFKYKESAFNGVSYFLHKYQIPTKNKNFQSSDDVNAIMIDFISETVGSICCGSLSQNAEFCQSNWSLFVSYITFNYQKKNTHQ